MRTIHWYRLVAVLSAGVSGALFVGLGDIKVLAWRALVAGLGAAFAAVALLSYGQAVRLTK